MDKDAYPDVPRELLRRPRRNKQKEAYDALRTSSLALLDRLSDFGIPDEPHECAKWVYHVEPAIERLREALRKAKP